MAAPPWMPNGVVGWPPTGLSGGIQTRLLGFVKTALLRQLVPPNSLVCDLFCGRGLDTERWAEAGVGRYVGVDLSASALEEAQEQWEQHDRPFPAEFCELDPCMVDLEAHLEDQGLPADIVSCLSHLQDSFTSEEMVKRLLKNVEAVLKPGGYFFGTAPDSSTIWYKYQKAVQEAMKAGSLRLNGTLPSVRTDIYKITFDDDRFHAFGSKYHMRFTDDGLPAQPQLLVHFPSLISLAKEVGLECVEIQNLNEFYDDYSGPFADVLRSCCGSLVDLKGVSVLDAKGRLNGQALDVLSLYTTFIFKKGDSALPNSQGSPSLEPVFKTSTSAAKYLTNFPSQYSETFPYSTIEETGRKEHQIVKREDHGPSMQAITTISNAQNEQSQRDLYTQNTTETEPPDPVEDLPDSRVHLETWHDQGEGMSEALQEATAVQNSNENVCGLDSSNEGKFDESLEEDLNKRHSSSPPNSLLLQRGTVDDDNGCHAPEEMLEPAVAQTECRTSPSEGASNSGARFLPSTDREEPHQGISAARGHRTCRVIGTSEPLTLIESEQVSLMVIEHVEEPSPADHGPKHSLRETNESLDESSREDKQQEPALAVHSPEHSLRGVNDSLDNSSRGENHKESPLGDHGPKHYMRRAHENPSRSQQELSQGEHRSSKHYLRRSYESRDEGSRREKQQQEQPQVVDPYPKRHLRRTHENLDQGNWREKDKESPSTELDASRHYERRAHENVDDRTRMAKQQEHQHGDNNSSKHYMRRSHDGSDESNRSEKAHDERVRGQSGRSKWVDRTSDEPRRSSQSSQGSRSQCVVTKKFPSNSSKQSAATAAYVETDLPISNQT